MNPASEIRGSHRSFTAVLLMAASLVACHRGGALSDPPTRVASNTLISKPGRYDVADIGVRLETWVGPSDTIVHYRATDLRSGETLLLDNVGGGFSRRYFVFDKDGNLWVYSGDLGNWVWTLSDGEFVKVSLQQASPELLRKLPAEYYNALPNSLKPGLAEYAPAQND